MALHADEQQAQRASQIESDPRLRLCERVVVFWESFGLQYSGEVLGGPSQMQRADETTKEYVLFMHNDAPDGGKPRPAEEWGAYFQKLNAEHVFEGGSSIGGGFCMNRNGTSPEISSRIFGFIRIRVRDLEHAKELVALNPVFRAGGTVEIRDLE